MVLPGRKAAMGKATHAGRLIVSNFVALAGRNEDDRIVRSAQALRVAGRKPVACAVQVPRRHPEILAAHADIELHRVLTRLDLGIGNLAI